MSDLATFDMTADEAPLAESTGEVVLFESPDGDVRVEVLLEDDTVWLAQEQMSDLFGRDQSVISRHLNNVFKEGELPKEGFMQILHKTSDEGGRPVTVYNLDVVISVGYRVKSARGTQFRQWATGILKSHLVDGYTLNQKRLEARGVELEQAVALLSSTLRNQHLITDEGQAVLDVVQRYARSWRLLREFDENLLLANPGRTPEEIAELDIDAARSIIRTLRDQMVTSGEDPGLFGQERSDGLDSILQSIEQTFDGEHLYPTIESRAAHLLYFVIKDHPLVDGNKRSGSLLFLEYLRRNGALFTTTGAPRFTDTALVGLALLVAESQPSDKELIIRLVQNLLVDDAEPS